jgi:hypothetical protein
VINCSRKAALFCFCAALESTAKTTDTLASWYTILVCGLQKNEDPMKVYPKIINEEKNITDALTVNEIAYLKIDENE